MTVKELIEKLQQMPQDLEVLSGLSDSWCQSLNEVSEVDNGYGYKIVTIGHTFID